jgi:hypothetical protein
VQFSRLFSELSRPVRDMSEISSFLVFTRFISTPISPAATPNSAARRARCAAYALATIALVGMQPVFTHVPPKSLRSTIATFCPAPANRLASEGPAWPVPMMIASYCVFIAFAFIIDSVCQRGEPCLLLASD